MTEKVKVGRPALNLSPEKRKRHNEELRKKRKDIKDQALKRLAAETLVLKVLKYGEENKEKAIEELMNDSRWSIRFNPTKEIKLAGYNGERLSRRKQDESEI